MSNFLQFNLDKNLLKTLAKIGYQSPTSIQEQTIPKILAGFDLIASAQTGTGKTAAFLLPILHRLAIEPGNNNQGPRILILVPTRELAIQVSEEAKKFSAHHPQIKTVCIYGGIPYPIQNRALSKPFSILVATPGRLIDHLERRRINLSRLEVLILDEADRMLDMGFIDDIHQIAKATPSDRQTLLFSATIDKKILPVSKKLQRNPHEIRIETTLSNEQAIEKRLYYVDNLQHKTHLLEHLFENNQFPQTIVFTSTKKQADELAGHLYDKGYAAGALHGDMNQKQRTRTINKLRLGELQVLVATDVAARGIDITSITHVINFDLPRNPEDFIHRIGRTGRAGAEGTAITFATYKEKPWLTKIDELMKEPMTVHSIIGLEPKSKEAPRINGFKPHSPKSKRPKGGFKFSRRKRSNSEAVKKS